jgi:hypothetical protein
MGVLDFMRSYSKETQANSANEMLQLLFLLDLPIKAITEVQDSIGEVRRSSTPPGEIAVYCAIKNSSHLLAGGRKSAKATKAEAADAASEGTPNATQSLLNRGVDFNSNTPIEVGMKLLDKSGNPHTVVAPMSRGGFSVWKDGDPDGTPMSSDRIRTEFVLAQCGMPITLTGMRWVLAVRFMVQRDFAVPSELLDEVQRVFQLDSQYFDRCSERLRSGDFADRAVARKLCIEYSEQMLVEFIKRCSDEGSDAGSVMHKFFREVGVPPQN